MVCWCVVEPERLGHRARVAGDPLAVPEGVAVGRFDRLSPVAHHREVGLLQPADLAGDVHQVHPCVEPR